MTNKSMNKFRRRLKKCDIIVVKKSGNSKPCLHCLNYLKKIGVRRVYYTIGQEFKMEKVNEMQTDHISARYRSGKRYIK